VTPKTETLTFTVSLHSFSLFLNYVN
jgi:hypothetical protein